MAKYQRKNRKVKKSIPSPFKDYWNKMNYILFGVGLVLIVLGFVLMGHDSWNNPVSLTVSPLVLLAAYIVVFPLAIFYKKKKDNKEVESDDTGKS
jgi:ATP/ADP translocase